MQENGIDNQGSLAEFERLWMEVLGVESVEDDDDFYDLGGHSLSALRLSTLIREELDLTVTFADITEHRVFADLRELVRRAPAEPEDGAREVFDR